MTDITPKELRELAQAIYDGDFSIGDIDIALSLRSAADQLERQAWIPCSERMPETGVEVLTVFTLEDSKRYRGTDWIDPRFGVWCKYVNTTHWMPIPPLPPEGES